MSEQLAIVQTRFSAVLDELVKAASDERVRRAYEHGYKAGRSSAEVARSSYRRGYLTGYAAGTRRRPAFPDSTAPGGRPRSLDAPVGAVAA